jgi:hypothetical protein
MEVNVGDPLLIHMLHLDLTRRDRSCLYRNRDHPTSHEMEVRTEILVVCSKQTPQETNSLRYLDSGQQVDGEGRDRLEQV